MKKFVTVVNNALKNENLVKVRLKVDPIYAVDGKIAKYKGYEGYILAENNNKATVYLENCGVILTVPTDMLDYTTNLTKLEKFKICVVKYLKETNKLKQIENIAEIVKNCTAVETIEKYLINNGCTTEDLLNIYKSMYYEQL